MGSLKSVRCAGVVGDTGAERCVLESDSWAAQKLTQCLPAGAEGFTTQEDQEMLSRIEKQLKRRFAIGSQVSEHSIVQDFMRQVGQGPMEGWAVKPMAPGCCWGHETPSSRTDW